MGKIVYKKIVSSAIVSLLIFVLTACSSKPSDAGIPTATPTVNGSAITPTVKETTETPSSNESTATVTVMPTMKPSTVKPIVTVSDLTGGSYSITTATLSQGKINIQYPQITGLADKQKQKLINDLIKNDVWNNEIESVKKANIDEPDIIDELTLDLKYQVAIKSDDLLSVFYTGQGHLEGGIISNSLSATTINIKNATKVRLSDLVDIDETLIKRIRESTDITNELRLQNVDNELIYDIQKTDNQTIIQGLTAQEPYYTFFITIDSLVISLRATHAAGDYALVILPKN